MYEIPNFSSYLLSECKSKVIRKSNNSEVTKQTRNGSLGHFKLKNDQNKWSEISLNKILSLLTPPINPPNFIEVLKYPGVFVSKQGEVWSSPSTAHPLGKYLSVFLQKDRYAMVGTKYGPVGVHQLIAMAFIDQNYLDKGLCVMHLDDNKHNYSFNNLKVATYSQNNQAAYDTGVNPRKG